MIDPEKRLARMKELRAEGLNDVQIAKRFDLSPRLIGMLLSGEQVSKRVNVKRGLRTAHPRCS